MNRERYGLKLAGVFPLINALQIDHLAAATLNPDSFYALALALQSNGGRCCAGRGRASQRLEWSKGLIRGRLRTNLQAERTPVDL